MEKTGTVLRIERISLNDGEGMRTVIFLKGCPLRCAWCSTPESQKREPEVYYLKERCRLCGACAAACPEKALRFSTAGDAIVRNTEACTNCGKCVDVCNYRAQMMYGKTMSVSQVMEEVHKDEVFYFYSNGGVTLSGGDIFCQTDFAEALLDACDDSCIDTAAEMDLYTSAENVRRIIPRLGCAYIDLKCMNPLRHQRWTGVNNRIILENIRLADDICRRGALHLRIPVIAGVNDDRENIEQSAEFCKTLKNCRELEFLPYHRLGTHAYRQLMREYPMGDRTPMNRLDVYRRMDFLCDRDYPFRIRISGMRVYDPVSGKVPVTEEELSR
jgi:pyruvate formate lyase activating enzyme